MANEQNLIPQAHKITVEEASKGGKRSGEVRRERANLRKSLEALLEQGFKDKAGKDISGADAISIKLFEQAMKGNTRAFEVIRSTVGQDPVQKVMVSEVDQDVINEIEKEVLGE